MLHDDQPSSEISFEVIENKNRGKPGDFDMLGEMPRTLTVPPGLVHKGSFRRLPEHPRSISA